MGWLGRIFHNRDRTSPAARDYTSDTKRAAGSHIVTITAGAYNRDRALNRRMPMRDIEAHCDWEFLYATTIAGTLIDSEDCDLLSAGYTLQSDNEELRQQIEQDLTDIGYDAAIRAATKEAYKHGYGLIEKAHTASDAPMLVACSSVNLLPHYDNEAKVDEFIQYTGKRGAPTSQEIEVPLDRVIQVVLQPSLVDIGVSQIGRGYDAIIRHRDISKASAEIIWRHGYPKWDVNLGNADGTEAPADIPARVEGVTSDLAPGSEITTNPLVNISQLDQGGVPQIDTYGTWALQEVAVAMGLPRTKVGIQEGAEATAKESMRTYYNALYSQCQIIQRLAQRDILDSWLLPLHGAAPGDVRIVYGHPDPGHDLEIASYVSALTRIDPYDAFSIFTKEEIADKLGKKLTDEVPDGDAADRLVEENQRRLDANAENTGHAAPQ